VSALADKTIVVSGVTSGIGAALVARLLDEGARVAGIGRDAEKLARAASAWNRDRARFTPIVADLASAAARAAACDEARCAFDHVDVLVNNAAEVIYEPPLATSTEAWSRLFEVNVMSIIDLTKGLAPRMRAGSHVVNTSSVTTRFLPNERFAPYAVTKAAIDQLHAGLRLELEPRGIKTTLIAPGLVDTPIYDKLTGFEKTRAKIREAVPTWLAPADVADAIVWILTRPSHVVVGELVLFPQGQAR